jgi:hypothetical protein
VWFGCERFFQLVVDFGDNRIFRIGRETRLRMVQIFDASMSGKTAKAQYLGSVKGYIICWGFAPFWVGQSRQALENLQTTPSGGFNLEVRDGIYISGSAVQAQASASPVPVWLPWSGEIYVLNGGAPGDQSANVAIVEAVPC